MRIEIEKYNVGGGATRAPRPPQWEIPGAITPMPTARGTDDRPTRYIALLLDDITTLYSSSLSQRRRHENERDQMTLKGSGGVALSCSSVAGRCRLLGAET